MDDAAINRAVAERLGWKPDSQGWNYWDHPDGSRRHWELFTFATSLDAMAEAEDAMTSDEEDRYCQLLAEQVGGTFHQITATAGTRALAFLAATQNRVTATKEQTQ